MTMFIFNCRSVATRFLSLTNTSTTTTTQPWPQPPSPLMVTTKFFLILIFHFLFLNSLITNIIGMVCHHHYGSITRGTRETMDRGSRHRCISSLRCVFYYLFHSLITNIIRCSVPPPLRPRHEGYQGTRERETMDMARDADLDASRATGVFFPF